MLVLVFWTAKNKTCLPVADLGWGGGFTTLPTPTPPVTSSHLKNGCQRWWLIFHVSCPRPLQSFWNCYRLCKTIICTVVMKGVEVLLLFQQRTNSKPVHLMKCISNIKYYSSAYINTAYSSYIVQFQYIQCIVVHSSSPS